MFCPGGDLEGSQTLRDGRLKAKNFISWIESRLQYLKYEIFVGLGDCRIIFSLRTKTLTFEHIIK